MHLLNIFFLTFNRMIVMLSFTISRICRFGLPHCFSYHWQWFLLFCSLWSCWRSGWSLIWQL
jgi:hypothetical protein